MSPERLNLYILIEMDTICKQYLLERKGRCLNEKNARAIARASVPSVKLRYKSKR